MATDRVGSESVGIVTATTPVLKPDVNDGRFVDPHPPESGCSQTAHHGAVTTKQDPAPGKCSKGGLLQPQVVQATSVPLPPASTETLNLPPPEPHPCDLVVVQVAALAHCKIYEGLGRIMGRQHSHVVVEQVRSWSAQPETVDNVVVVSTCAPMTVHKSTQPPAYAESVAVSVFDMFKIGIGPSSSHTVGPMRAAYEFATALVARPDAGSITRVLAELFGSLGATGHGHGSRPAVMLGLEGELPETVDTIRAPLRAAEITANAELLLGGRFPIPFDTDEDLVLHRNRTLPGHPNGMIFTAFRGDEVVASTTYYSIGGGFVLTDDGSGHPRIVEDTTPVPFPFRSGDDLLAQCSDHRLTIPELMLANEMALGRTEPEIRAGLHAIWDVMVGCIHAGCATSGVLPGGLRVRRRAQRLYRDLIARDTHPTQIADPLAAVDWLTLWALAVNEENAAGGRVVTAPTNGAAGIVPSVLHYLTTFLPPVGDPVVDFLLTAGAVGAIYQQTASISGAEVGCQGEVGVACSMAAAGACQVWGGTPQQVSNAAEIGLEHHLGLTCDPVGGLVQIPCIERNAVASVQAITAARLALAGDGVQQVTLDQVIRTMMETGADMKVKYKETARGGLAVNIVAC